MAIGQWIAVLASLVPLMGCPSPPANEPRGLIVTAGFDSASQPPTRGDAAAPVRYYVSPEGSDTNSGDSAAPFRTIQKAADVAGPGDTVIVRAGTYTGEAQIVSLERGGFPGAWITFRSERRHTAVLDGQDGKSKEAWYFGRGVGYVRVEGFEIRHLQEHGFDFYGGGVHDIEVVRNLVHHIGRYCTDTSNGRTGASLGAGAHRIVFDGNVWHDIGRHRPGEQGCDPRTEYYQNHDHGIYVADADEITIQNNVFHAFKRGWAVHRYSSRGSPSRKLAILNNTFLGQNPYRPGQIIVASPTEGLRIENNIFHSPREAAIYFEDLRFPGASVGHNLIHEGVTRVGRPKGVTFSRNWENVDPRLEGEENVRLTVGSPAIDSGLSLVEVTHDADGVVRPRGTGHDLGAYER
ncbi:MAG TPA: choice-of-anchor Q domain-containing protein [Gemmatimonadales bacterium]|nr:choice-of-anchor Q domain-containing protein [Gemmatimonadales bacterium]